MATQILAGNTGAEQTRADFFYKPNIELLNQALAGKQKDYDTKLAGFKQLQAKVAEVPTLEGYDREQHFKKTAYYDNKINDVMKLYNGDLTKADVEFNGLLGEVGKDFNIHGEMTALKNRHDGYQADLKEISERRKKNEITEAQAYALTRELKNTRDIGIGTNPKQWNPWNSVRLTNAVDKAKVLKEFTEGWKSDSLQKWGEGQASRTVNGVVEWRSVDDEWVKESDVRKQAMTHLYDKLKETGELEHEWIYEKEVRGNNPSMDKYNEYLTNAQSLVDQNVANLEALNTQDGKELQETINRIYRERTGKDVLTVDGKVGQYTNQAKQILLKQLTEDAKVYSDEYNKVAGADDPLIFAETMMKNQFFEDLISTAVEPYVQKESFNKHKEDLRTMKDPTWEHAKAIELASINAGYAMRLAQFTFDLNNPKPDIIERLEEGITMPNPYDSVAALEESIGGIDGKGGSVVDALFNLIVDPTMSGQDRERDQKALQLKQQAGLNYEELAKATFEKDKSGNIVIIKADGSRFTVPNSSKTSLDIMYGHKNNAQAVLQEKTDALRLRKEVQEDVIEDGQYSSEEAQFLRGLNDTLAQATPDLENAYKAYKASFTSGLPMEIQLLQGAFGFNSPVSFEEFKNLVTFDKGNSSSLYGKQQRSPVINSLYSTKANLETQLKDPKVSATRKQEIASQIDGINKTIKLSNDLYSKGYLISNFNTASDQAISTRTNIPVSFTSSTLPFSHDGVDGKTVEKRREMVQQHFETPSNFNSMVLTVPDPKGGPIKQMTMDQYLGALTESDAGWISGGRNFTYKVTGEVIPNDSLGAWAVPVSIYEVGSDGKVTDKVAKTVTVYSDYSNYYPTYIKKYQQDPLRILDANMKTQISKGVNGRTYNDVEGVSGKSFSYDILRHQDKANPHIIDPISMGTVRLSNFPVPQYEEGPDGRQYPVFELDENNNYKLDENNQPIQKINYLNTDVPYDRGSHIIATNIENNNFISEFRKNGIPGGYVQTYVQRPDGRYESKLISRDRELINLMHENLNPNEIANKASSLGLNTHQITTLFKLKQEDYEYKNVKHAHPDQLKYGDPYRTGTVTYKQFIGGSSNSGSNNSGGMSSNGGM